MSKLLVFIGGEDFENLIFEESGKTIEEVLNYETVFQFSYIELEDDTQETLLKTLKKQEVSFDYDDAKNVGVYLFEEEK